MNNTGGAISFDAYIRDTQFAGTITRMERQLMGLSNVATREAKRMDDTFAGLGKLAAGYFTFDALKELPLQLIKVRGEVQQVEIAFKTMLKDQGKAEQLLRENIELAAQTPFEFKDVVQGSKQLLAYGSSANTVVKEVAMLGDVAAGVSAPLGDIVYLYGTLRSQGRAYAQDIRQFAGRGIPIYQELANVLKVDVSRVNDLVSAGKVGFPQVEQAFKNMTGAGGQFEGLMKEQSKSLTGLLSNLKDEIFQATNDIGKANEGLLNDLLKGGITVVKNYQPILDILKVLIIGYGAYRAALLVTAAAQAAMALSTNVKIWFDLAKGITSAADAQALFNLTTKANPWVLATTALVGLIAAIAIYSHEVDAAGKAQQTLTDARNAANNGAAGELAKIQLLTTAINNEKLSREARNKKLQELIAISPEHLKSLTLENVKTSQGTDAINTYIDALKRKLELQEIEKELTASIQRQNDIKSGKDELGYFSKVGIAISSGSASQSMVPVAGQNAQASYNAGIKRANAERAAEEDVIQNKLKERIKTLDETGNAAAKAGAKSDKAAARTVEWYDQQIKALKDQQSQTSTTSAQYAKQQKEIDNFERAKRRITGEQTSAEKKAAKEADKAGALGSRAYYESIAQKASDIIAKTDAGNAKAIKDQIDIRDAAQQQADIIKRSQEQQIGSLEYYESLIAQANQVLSKTPETDTSAITTQQYIISQATEKAEAVRKKTAVKTFTEELDEKRKAYQTYQQWVDAVGQAAADAQFADLKKSGDTYVDYLTGEITKLQALSAFTPLTKTEGDKLATLTAERDEATGKKKRIDLFTESLAKAKAEAGSLTDYLAILKQKQDELGTSNTPFAIAGRLAVAQETVQAQNDRTAQLRDFLQSVQGSEAQRTAITKKYADLRAEIERQAKAGILSDYAERLAAVTKAQGEENDAVNKSMAEQSGAYKELSKVIDVEGRKALQLRLDRLKAYQKYLERMGLRESDLYKQVTLEVRDATRDLQKDTLNTINTLASLGGQIGGAFQQAGGTIGQVGTLLEGLTSQANNVTKAFDKTATTTDLISAGVSGAIGLFDILTSSANQRQKAEEDYYRSAIGFQQQYNLALNEQIGLQTEQKSNVFVTDNVGKLKDGVAKYADAQKRFQASIGALSAGRAKVGQGNAVDAGNIGKGIGSGAALGAAIGTAVPIIGTVVGAIGGAIIGGLTGLFGGKKKEDQFASLLATYPGLISKGADGWASVNKELAKSLIDQNQVDENTKQLINDTLEWQKAIEDAKKQIDDVVQTLAGSLGNDLRDALVGAWKDGTDAAEAFGNSVSKVLENMLSQIIFNQVFKQQFDQLQKELADSLATGSDGTDAFGKFFQAQGELTKQFNDQLEAAQKEAEKYGLSVFKKTDTAATASKSAMTGAIKGVTEETAGVIEGQMNAIRIQGAQNGLVARDQLLHLANIDLSTSTSVTYLKSIDRKLDALGKDPLRATGYQPG